MSDNKFIGTTQIPYEKSVYHRYGEDILSATDETIVFSTVTHPVNGSIPNGIAAQEAVAFKDLGTSLEEFTNPPFKKPRMKIQLLLGVSINFKMHGAGVAYCATCNISISHRGLSTAAFLKAENNQTYVRLMHRGEIYHCKLSLAASFLLGIGAEEMMLSCSDCTLQSVQSATGEILDTKSEVYERLEALVSRTEVIGFNTYGTQSQVEEPEYVREYENTWVKETT